MNALRIETILAAVLLGAAACSAACGDDDGDAPVDSGSDTRTPDSGTPPPPPDDGGMPDMRVADAGDDDGGALDSGGADAGATVRIRGVVMTPFGGIVAGATVADALHPEVTSALSDDDGVFALRVPAGVPLLVSVEREGSLTSLVEATPLSADVDGARLVLGTRADLDATTEPLPPSTPRSAAVALTFATGTFPAVGIQAMATGGTLDVSYYRAGEMMTAPVIDPALEASAGAGAATGFTGVLAGPEELVVHAASIAGRDCVALEGWEGSSPGDARVPVRPDAITYVTFLCEPPAGMRAVSGVISTFTPTEPVGSGTPLAGVEVCQLPTTHCATSIAGGVYVLDVPEGPDVALSFEMEGRLPIVIPLETGTGPRERDVSLPAADYLASLATAFGVTQSASAGAIEFFTTPEGSTVSLASGTGDGPHYLSGGLPDPMLTATGTPGWGFFLDVAAGEVEVAFDHADPMRECTEMGDAWESPTAEHVRAPVVAGHLTFVSMRCPLPP